MNEPRPHSESSSNRRVEPTWCRPSKTPNNSSSNARNGTVLTDGNVSEEQSGIVRSTKKRIEETGAHFSAIGLSLAPREFQNVFPGAPVLQDPSDLPTVFGDLLTQIQTEAA